MARQGKRQRDAEAGREDRGGDRPGISASHVEEEAAQPAAQGHAGAGAHHQEGIDRAERRGCAEQPQMGTD